MSRHPPDVQEPGSEKVLPYLPPRKSRPLNLKLLLSTQDQAGYEVLSIARIEQSARAQATPRLDEAYIPPVLACDAWRPLNVGILKQVHNYIGKKSPEKTFALSSRKGGVGETPRARRGWAVRRRAVYSGRPL